MPVKIVFTTHATQLGRYLCGGDDNFYQNLPLYNWQREAAKFGVEGPAGIERIAALSADAFTTVSDITGRECMYFLGRKPDVVTPNGLNIERYEALHEFQVLHKEYKDKINQFVMGHFFQNYKFDLNETLYFFTSGRFEYVNKGYDLTLEAIRRLNYLMKRYRVNKTVVMFIVTKQPDHSINPMVLQSRALLEEIKQTCDSITKQVVERLFFEVRPVTGSVCPLPENTSKSSTAIPPITAAAIWGMAVPSKHMPGDWMNRPASLTLVLPPLSAAVLQPVAAKP